MERGIDFVIFVAEHSGVIGVGGCPLEPVQNQFLQARHVGAEATLPLGDGHLFALADEPGQIGCRLPGRRSRQDVGILAGFSAGRLVQGPGLIAHLCGMAQVPCEALRIEIDIGDRGEEELEHGPIDFTVGSSELGGSMGVHRHALGGINQKVLQGGRFGIFSTVPDNRAAGPFGGLFTLIAIHRNTPC